MKIGWVGTFLAHPHSVPRVDLGLIKNSDHNNNNILGSANYNNNKKEKANANNNNNKVGQH